MPLLHAIVSASQAHKWIPCTKSARLCYAINQKLGEKSSEFAEEGTAFHAYMEILMSGCATPPISEEEFSRRMAEWEATTKPEWIADCKKYAKDCADIAVEELNRALSVSEDAQLMPEQRLDFSDWVPEGFGTGDVVIIDDNTLTVIDWKYGRGVEVSAVNNPQARLYGLGAYSMFHCLYDFKTVKMMIVQPRLGNVSCEELPVEELLAWGEWLKPIAEKAYKGEGEYKSGEHCRFCAAKAICTRRVVDSLNVLNEVLTTDTITLEQIAELLPVAEEAKKWLEDIQSYAYDRAMAGERVPGYKLVAGRKPNKQYSDPLEVLDILASHGVPDDKYIKPRELLTPSQLETSIGKKKFKELKLSEYVTQGEGKPTLVPMSDKREEISLSTNDFDDLNEEPV